MVGVVLGGGKGTRLSPLTAQTSKHLLPIGGKPMIVRTIEQLSQASVKDILLVIDEKFASQFMQVLGDGSELGLRSLSYLWQSSDGKGLPTAISKAENVIKTDKIVVACGDVLVENGIKQPIFDFLKQKKGARITAVHTKDTAGYSCLKTSKDKVEKILPKDKIKHLPGLIDVGIYMFHIDVFNHIKKLAPSGRGETEIWDLNNVYARKGELSFTIVNGWWSDAGGSIGAYQEANNRYENKK